MRKIGFCHGATHKLLDPYSEKNINLFKNCGCNAIEVNCHSVNDVVRLDSISRLIEDFEYRSVHLPCDLRYKENKESNDLLKQIENFYNKIGASLAVVHPDTIEDWDVFDKYDSVSWAVENMDDRETSHRNVYEMKELFAQNKNWNFVLDVGHCNANDKTMKLAKDFILELKHKIKEIHLSGYEVFHDPLHRTKQKEIIEVCKYLDVPIIIESTLERSDGEEGVVKEYNYIQKYLE